MVTAFANISNIQHPTLMLNVGIIYLMVCLKCSCLMHTSLIIFKIIDSFLKGNFLRLNRSAKPGRNYQNRKESKKEGK